MMKDAYWFRHDSNSTTDPKMMTLLRAHGWAGYGMFWRIVELMRDTEGYKLERSRIQDVAYAMRADELPQVVETCCSIGLFVCDETHIWSKRLCQDMQARDAQREAGRSTAAMRWGGNGKLQASNRQAIAEHYARTRQDKTMTGQDKTEQSEMSFAKASPEVETPDLIPYEDIIGELNDQAGRSYEWEGARGEKNRVMIRALWKRGFRGKDFQAVIDNKVRDWGHLPKKGEKDMRPYLRPATLFMASKFEGYLNGGGL